MKKGTIVVFDDEERVMRRFERDIRSVEEVDERYVVRRVNSGDFIDSLNEIVHRQVQARMGVIDIESWSIDIDEADIIIIDYDLTHQEGLRNGEEISYLVGCFSRCKYIIILNRLGENAYDLTLSRVNTSHADLNTSSSDLSNPGLWNGVSIGYRPWHWPALLKYIDGFEDRKQHIEKHFTKPLYGLLGFPEEVIRSISMTAGEQLGVAQERILEATPKDFLHQSDFVLAAKDRHIDFPEELSIKIVTSRLFTWLDRFILQGQNILVDAPHLISSYPSLLHGDPESGEILNKTAGLGRETDLGIDLDLIKEYEYSMNHLVSRPYWYRAGISQCNKLIENTKPADRKKLNFLFAEDASLFFPREECKEFLSGLDTPLRRRYIKGDFDKINYRPARNLLLGE